MKLKHLIVIAIIFLCHLDLVTDILGLISLVKVI